MEEADLSFASLLLALRNSTDELDNHETATKVKPSLNFHKDFYTNTSSPYDNECSTAAESLFTLSSCSTDIDSPLNNDHKRSTSTIGWKRRSDPCISASGLQDGNSLFSNPFTHSFPSASSLFNYSSSSKIRTDLGSLDERKSDNNRARPPHVKKICKLPPNSKPIGSAIPAGRQTKGKTTPTALSNAKDVGSNNNSNSRTAHGVNLAQVLEIKKEIDKIKESGNSSNNRIKKLQELKPQRKDQKEGKEGKDPRSHSPNSLTIDYKNVVERKNLSPEEQKEMDDKDEAQLLKIARGRYKCSRCGALKTNHDCPIIEEYAGSVSTHTERLVLRPEEFLSGGMAGFSAALKTCNLITVRGEYVPCATHTVSPKASSHSSSLSSSISSSLSSSLNCSLNGSLSACLLTSQLSSQLTSLGGVRSPSSYISRSLSLNTIENSTYCNETDNNTTNSNSDDDSDSCKASTTPPPSTRADGSTSNKVFTSAYNDPSAASNSLPLSSSKFYGVHQTVSPGGNMRGLEERLEARINGIYGINGSSSNSNVNAMISNSINSGNINGNNEKQPHLRLAFPGTLDRDSRSYPSYQSLPYSGVSGVTVAISPRDYNIPLPL